MHVEKKQCRYNYEILKFIVLCAACASNARSGSLTVVEHRGAPRRLSLERDVWKLELDTDAHGSSWVLEASHVVMLCEPDCCSVNGALQVGSMQHCLFPCMANVTKLHAICLVICYTHDDTTSCCQVPGFIKRLLCTVASIASEMRWFTMTSRCSCILTLTCQDLHGSARACSIPMLTMAPIVRVNVIYPSQCG